MKLTNFCFNEGSYRHKSVCTYVKLEWLQLLSLSACSSIHTLKLNMEILEFYMKEILKSLTL